MKNLITAVLLFCTLGFIPTMPAAAATPIGPEGSYEYVETGGCPAGTYRVRRHTRKKKKFINSAIAGGIGAAIGGGIGGGRGALIGLGSGAGGYLVYRYVRDRKGRCVRRYSRG